MITLKPARSASEFCCMLDLIFEAQNKNIPRQYDVEDDSQNSYSALIRSHGTAYQVLDGTKLVGICWVELFGIELFIHGLVIKEHFRSRGIGTQVMFAVQKLYSDRSRLIALKVHQSNLGAIRFYEKLGFTFQEFDEDNCFWLMHKWITPEPEFVELA